MFEFRGIIKYGLIEQNVMRGYTSMTEYQDIHSGKPRVPYLERISNDKYTCKTCLILFFLSHFAVVDPWNPEFDTCIYKFPIYIV